MDLNKLTRLKPQDRKREYVSGGFQRSISPLLQEAILILSRYQDDLNREFSDQAYEQMVRDPAVAASVDVLKSLILSEPLRLISREQDRKHPDYAEAQGVTDFCTHQLKTMKRSLQIVMWEAMDAIIYGSALVENVYDDQATDGTKPIIKLVDLKTRSRGNYGLIVDRHFNVLGAVQTEQGTYGIGSGVYTGSTKPNPEAVIPREKFWLVTFNGRNSDPRGQSLLRPAWNPYFLKTQVFPAYLKYLVQFASPSIVGFTPEGAEDVEIVDENGIVAVDADGIAQTISAEEDMLNTLLGFQSGTVAVLKGGSRMELIQSQGQGEAFARGVELFDRQIAMAILKTHRTLLEAKHGSKADSESAADITDVFVASLRELVATSFTRDVLRPLVTANYGEEIADRFTPEATLKSTPKQDFSKTAEAIGKLWTAQYLHASQVAEVDAMIGLPERDIEDWMSQVEEDNDMKRMDQVERMKLLNPQAGTEEEEAPTEPEEQEEEEEEEEEEEA